MDPPHAIALELVTEAVRAAFGTGWRFRVQTPLHVDALTNPMPDLSVVAGQPRGQTAHPTTAALVVEVADTSLAVDTTEKAERYATAGILDYWVLDVTGRRLLVFRDPAPRPANLDATAFRTPLALGPNDTVTPLAAPQASIRAADLLP
jgi:Uma2 family endonuclease